MTPERLEEIRADIRQSIIETNCQSCEDYHATHAMELLREVDTLRESIEAVKALQRYADVEESQYGVMKSADGEWIYRDDVLDVLEGIDQH